VADWSAHVWAHVWAHGGRSNIGTRIPKSSLSQTTILVLFTFRTSTNKKEPKYPILSVVKTKFKEV